MKKILLLGILIVLVISLSALALAAGGYSLPWWTSDSGGGTSTGTGYSLSGTIGQPDAGPILSGPGYQLSGGFWSGSGGGVEKKIYLPCVVR